MNYFILSSNLEIIQYTKHKMLTSVSLNCTETSETKKHRTFYITCKKVRCFFVL